MFFAFALSTNVVLAENDNDKLNQSEMLPIQIEMLDANDEETKKLYINSFMMQNGKKFTTADVMIVKQKLESLTPEQIQSLLQRCAPGSRTYPLGNAPDKSALFYRFQYH